MNRSIMILWVALAWMSWACGEAPSSQATGEDTPTEVTQDETSAATQGFSTSVLNDSIPSPRKELSGAMGQTELTINYGSPSVKGRAIWGDLVPYDKVWRTGANEATRISVSQDVEIGGQTLPAGEYGFFTIPGESDWTLIFNSVAEQWGSYEYDESKDVMRVKVVPTMSEEVAEAMTFSVEDAQTVVLAWEKVRVPFAIGAGG